MVTRTQIFIALVLLLPGCSYFYNGVPWGSDFREFGRMTFPEEGVHSVTLEYLPEGTSREEVAAKATGQLGRRLGEGEMERLRGISHDDENALGYQLYGYGLYPFVDTRRYLFFVFDEQDRLEDVVVDVRNTAL